MDIISNLPEPILIYVLSFLSTKEVIQTSVLARRWKYVWTSVSNIDLEDKSPEEVSNGSIIEFVNRVITLHDASDITRLRLRLHLPTTFSRLNSWIHAALCHNVEELDLFLYWKQQSELPCCIFASPSLVFLEITAHLTFKPTPSTCFIKLKKLHLSLVSFSDDVSTQRLFSNCPVLEELAVNNCDWKHIQSVTISIPTLKSLSIELPYPRAGLNCLINIFSSNITYLYCSIQLDVNMCICNLPYLDRALVDIPGSKDMMDEVGYHAGRIFSSIHNVRILWIQCDIMEFQNLQHHMPIFHKLTHLELELELGFEESRGYVQLMKFLNKTPKLVDINLFKSSEDDAYDDWDEYDSEDGEFLLEEDEIPQNAPSCFRDCLKIFSISYFEGHSKEMELASFVLKNAIILEKMNIYCNGILSEDENKQILLQNQLNKLKVSESCVIELHKGFA